MAVDQIPTPEQAEHAMFIVKWWKEFFLGLGALLGVVAIIKKGQKIPVVVAWTPKEAKRELELCKHQVKSEMYTHIHNMLEEHKKDMLMHIELMIKANK